MCVSKYNAPHPVACTLQPLKMSLLLKIQLLHEPNLQPALDAAALAVLGLLRVWPLGNGQVDVCSALEAEGGNGTDPNCRAKIRRRLSRVQKSQHHGLELAKSLQHVIIVIVCVPCIFCYFRITRDTQHPYVCADSR